MADQRIPLTATERTRRYRLSHYDKVREAERKYKYKKLYGITIEDKENMLIEQEGKCLLCGNRFTETKDANIDHDHETNEVRGLLCTYCNLRMATVDDEEWLDKAMKYRNKFRKEGRLP